MSLTCRGMLLALLDSPVLEEPEVRCSISERPLALVEGFEVCTCSIESLLFRIGGSLGQIERRFALNRLLARAFGRGLAVDRLPFLRECGAQSVGSSLEVRYFRVGSVQILL